MNYQEANNRKLMTGKSCENSTYVMAVVNFNFIFKREIFLGSFFGETSLWLLPDTVA